MLFEFSLNIERRNALAASRKLSKRELRRPGTLNRLEILEGEGALDHLGGLSSACPQDGLLGSLLVLPGFGADWCCYSMHLLKNPLPERCSQRRSTDNFLYNSKMPSESYAKIASLPLPYTKPHLHYPAPHLARDGLQ